GARDRNQTAVQTDDPCLSTRPREPRVRPPVHIEFLHLRVQKRLLGGAAARGAAPAPDAPGIERLPLRAGDLRGPQSLSPAGRPHRPLPPGEECCALRTLEDAGGDVV